MTDYLIRINEGICNFSHILHAPWCIAQCFFLALMLRSHVPRVCLAPLELLERLAKLETE